MRTTIAGTGANDSIEAQVDPTSQAARVNLKPMEYVFAGGAGGHFNLTCGYSNTAAKPAAGSDVLSLRWMDSRMLFILKRLSVWVTTTTTYTATLNQDIEAFRATGFSVSPSAGTQIIPVAGGGQKARTSFMASTLLANGSSAALWVSSGDLLTTGTRTLDTQSFGYCSYQNPITTPAIPFFGVLYEIRSFGQHPIILAQNEGIVIQTPIGNSQAAGVSKYKFVFEYAEATQY